MESAPQIVEVQGVHGYIDQNGVAWLNAKDVAHGLGYIQVQSKNGKEYTSIRYERINIYLTQWGFPHRVGENDFIPENLFYLLAMKASNEAAKKFQLKIANEILPSIRKYGVYATDAFIEKAIANPDFAIKILAELKKTRAERDAALNQVAILEPKADYCDNVLLSDEHLTSELIAKEYGHSSIWLHNILVQFNIIFKRRRTYFLKAKFANQGYRISETVTLEGGKTVVNHYWTQKGRNFIYNFLKAKGIVPLRERPELMQDLF